MTSTRGLMLNDEGYILQAAERIAAGEVMYRDFFIAYTPLTPIVTALSFIFLGESVISARLIALGASLLTLFIIYKVASLLTKNEILKWSPVLFFLVWGPMHINFSWPVLYATSAGVATLYFLLLAKKNKNSKYYFYAGLFGISTLLFKQNFGVASILIIIIQFILYKKERVSTNLLYLTLGIIPLLLLWLLYIFATGSQYQVIENFHFYFYQKLVVEGVDRTPFIYPGSFASMTAKFFFYTIPLLLAIITTVVVWRKKKELILIPVFVGLFYIAGIRPVTDYVHYTPLLALCGLLILLLSLYIKEKKLKILLATLYVILISTGIYASIFRAYYRWEAPLIEQTILLDNRKINVLIDKKNEKLITDFQKYVNKHTLKNEYIFINYYSPSLYFILDRKNPTRFIYLSPNVVDYMYQREIEKNLKDKNVSLVITSYLLRQDKSHLSNYIRKNYKLDKVMHNYMFWKKI